VIQSRLLMKVRRRPSRWTFKLSQTSTSGASSCWWAVISRSR
jgi:hypothetical protein